MPRILGVRERLNKIWYDTGFIEPGQGEANVLGAVKLFGQKNIGNPYKTNLKIAGIPDYERTSIIHSIGIRLIGKTRAEEDLLLDHLRVNLIFGDIPQFDILGPHASTLRHVFSKDELDRLEIVADDHPTYSRNGYEFKTPLVLPVRQNLSVWASASPQLPEAINFRVYLFGQSVRDPS